MATLEKIRSKSVLLIVVIGVALLAFIIGDAITNSRNLFGDRSTIAKVGKVKIDYNDFARKREELQQQLQNNPNVDPQLISEMALEQLISEQLLDQAVKDAGIKVSSEQLRLYMLENGMQMPKMQQLLQALNGAGFNVVNPQEAYDYIFNPTRHGASKAQMASYQQYWLAMESEAKVQLSRQIYGQLLFGTFVANDLDEKYLYEDEVNSQAVKFAYKPFGKLDEKKYPVNDKELQEAYDKNKEDYRVNTPTKMVSVIAVAVSPSDVDKKEADKLAQETENILINDTVGAAAKALQKQGVSLASSKQLLKQVPAQYRSFVQEAALNDVKIVSNNARGFAVLKMGKKSYETDSIQLNLVSVMSETLAPKVLASLNSGLDIDSINTKYSADSVFINKEMWIPQYSSQNGMRLAEAQLDSLSGAEGKYVVLQEVPGQGAVLAKVTKRTAPVEVYSYEAATYNLVPSTATVNDAVTKLEGFLATNNTTDKFNAEAAKAGYTLFKYNVTAYMPALPLQSNAATLKPLPLQQYGPLFDGSSQVVGWVVRDGKAGKVSPLFENQNMQEPMLYAVAVEAEFDEYAPLAVVKEQLTEKVRAEKAGAEMVKQFSGKGNIDATAQAMGVNATDLPAFTLMSSRNSIRDAKVAGRIAGTKAGAPVAVVAGDFGVYAYQVTGAEKSKVKTFDKAAYAQRYRQMLNLDANLLLKGKNKEVNNIYKFVEVSR